MLQLLTSQAESDRAFDRWVKAMIDGGVRHGRGWVVKHADVFFDNYGHGEPGTVEDEIMFGSDPDFGSGVVKIVRPEASRRDKGKLTAIARDGVGRLVLLRQGWLKRNRLSGEVRSRFAELTGLSAVPVLISGKPSDRAWYVVAELDARSGEVVASTAKFARACATARTMARGRAVTTNADGGHGYGLDERGHVVTVHFPARTTEVVALQGYVWEDLKKLLGANLTKPMRGGFSVDGVIAAADILLEIKTSVAAHDVYAAVGQLSLYPSLIGLRPGLQPVLLTPDEPAMPPALAAALEAAGISVFTYNVGRVGGRPKIEFAGEFLARCREGPAAGM